MDAAAGAVQRDVHAGELAGLQCSMVPEGLAQDSSGLPRQRTVEQLSQAAQTPALPWFALGGARWAGRCPGDSGCPH